MDMSKMSGRKEKEMRGENQGQKQANIVLCGANAYEQKYYFNETFQGIPQSIKDELHIICVLFTEEIGGIFTIAFEPHGNVVMETKFSEDDYLNDEIGSGLMVREISRMSQVMFVSLCLYFSVFVLHEKLDLD